MDDSLSDKQADNSSIRWSQLISQLSYSVFRGWWRHNRRQKIKRISLWWQRNKMFFNRLWAEPRVSSLMMREMWITRSVGQHCCRLRNGNLLDCFQYYHEVNNLPPTRAATDFTLNPSMNSPHPESHMKSSIFTANNSKISRNECFFEKKLNLTGWQ